MQDREEMNEFKNLHNITSKLIHIYSLNSHYKIWKKKFPSFFHDFPIIVRKKFLYKFSTRQKDLLQLHEGSVKEIPFNYNESCTTLQCTRWQMHGRGRASNLERCNFILTGSECLRWNDKTGVRTVPFSLGN